MKEDVYLNLLTEEEKYILQVRALFQNVGYKPYKMSKFETYELYASHRDFLPADQVISFTDGDGRLMALKPDVTLSMIKNVQPNPYTCEKVYYNESVYRIPRGGQNFKEITQVGAECFGQVTTEDICENLLLAAGALATASDTYSLEIADLDILIKQLDQFDLDREQRGLVFRCIGNKNRHELGELLEICIPSANERERLMEICMLSGTLAEGIERLESNVGPDAKWQTEVLRAIADAFAARGMGDRIRLEASVLPNVNYYNGIVFRGFLPGAAAAVLNGGEYDNLLRRLKKPGRAVGFAIYMDPIMQFARDIEEA